MIFPVTLSPELLALAEQLNVRSLTIYVPLDGPVIVSLECLPDETPMREAATVFRNYELVERNGSSDGP